MNLVRWWEYDEYVGMGGTICDRESASSFFAVDVLTTPPAAPPPTPCRASEGLATSSTGAEGGEEEGRETKETKETSTTEEGGGGGGELPWAYTSDDSIAFPVDCVLQGDLLVRKAVLFVA